MEETFKLKLIKINYFSISTVLYYVCKLAEHECAKYLENKKKQKNKIKQQSQTKGIEDENLPKIEIPFPTFNIQILK